MRDYGAVSPQFWIGKTGKALRGNLPAQLVALYLMTSPHANMIGVYYCPIDTIAKETGLSLEGASEALRSLEAADYCHFDPSAEEVFVCRMAAYQVGEQLEPRDNRCKGIARDVEKIMSPQLQGEFRAIYSVAFHLPDPAPKQAPTPPTPQAPPEPLRSQDQKQKQGQEQDQEQGKTPRKRAAPSAEIDRPDDVSPQTWADWLQLRKGKRAAVSVTVLNEARLEAGKAGMTLERFLTVWCIRGSQGLQADWLRPDERGPAGMNKQEALEASNRAIGARFLENDNATH